MSAKERRTVLTEIGLAEGKEDVMIYDYLDSYCAVFIKMYRERIKAYRKMGYKIVEPTIFSEENLCARIICFYRVPLLVEERDFLVVSLVRDFLYVSELSEA